MDVVIRRLSCLYNLYHIVWFIQILLKYSAFLGPHDQSSRFLRQYLVNICTLAHTSRTYQALSEYSLASRSIVWFSITSSSQAFLYILALSQRCWHSHQHKHNLFNIMLVEHYKNPFDSNKTRLTRVVVLKKLSLIVHIICDQLLVQLIIRGYHQNHTYKRPHLAWE